MRVVVVSLNIDTMQMCIIIKMTYGRHHYHTLHWAKTVKYSTNSYLFLHLAKNEAVIFEELEDKLKWKQSLHVTSCRINIISSYQMSGTYH